MAQLKAIVEYCNDLLRINEFKDYCPNGLQVEGKAEVNKVICGVTASQALIDAAIEQQADAILVHHGYFWKNEAAAIVGIKRKRIQALLQADISLLAYHLPLDAHPVYGNNKTLADKLDIQVDGYIESGSAKGLLWYGQLPQPLPAQALVQRINTALERQPLHLPSGCAQTIQRIAWCTGGAQHYIEDAAAMRVDAYISGEVSEQTYHLAQELGIHYFGAGHHATESYGVQALAAHLAEKFSLDTAFINVPNPV